MREITIDLNRIKAALPARATVQIGKQKADKGNICYIECKCYPSMSEAEFEMCKEWQREIIGRENIIEHYTKTECCHWYVYLKRIVIEFDNVADSDFKSMFGETIGDEIIKRKTP